MEGWSTLEKIPGWPKKVPDVTSVSEDYLRNYGVDLGIWFDVVLPKLKTEGTLKIDCDHTTNSSTRLFLFTSFSLHVN